MLKGTKVYHTQFGAGSVVGETADTVSIHFAGERGSRGATRKFLTTALYDDAGFPRDRNPEAWAARGK